jgi:SAM-dependent methyltransferase
LTAAGAGKQCPACGGTERVPLFSKGGWSVVSCAGCGLGALDPRPGPEETAALYCDAYFASRYDEGLAPGTPAMKRRLSGEAHRIRFFRPFKKTGRVLDIGCGRGYFLLACREKGYEVQGYDISEEGAEFVRTRLGIPVVTGPLEGAFEDASFDVVTMWHSLEHMADPASCIEAAGRLLKPGGVLVVDVPDYTGTDARVKWDKWENWDLPFHFYHFTPKALHALLSRHGFTVERKKRYHSDVIKSRLRKVPVLGLIARPIAKLFSGSSYAVVAKRNSDGQGR